MKSMNNFDRYGNQLGELACFFRRIALEVDESPDAILGYRYSAIMKQNMTMTYRNPVERVRFYEAAGYGDASVCLSCPGPSLSGMMLKELGTQEQSDQFHRYVTQHHARTFLAVTEPGCGSNLSNLKSRIQKNSAGYSLNSEKWLVGQGATGSVGVLIAKLSEHPLGLCAILISPQVLASQKNQPDSYIERTTLPMVGLRGARLGRLKFKNIAIADDAVLGGQLSVIERGMMALIKTFNCMRPCIGALAIGTAQALIDYSYYVKTKFSAAEKRALLSLTLHVSIARQFIYFAAQQYLQDPYETEHSSLAKIKATQLVESVANTVRSILGREALIEHPLIAKWHRDSYGFEYMEGTQAMQKINVYSAYQKKFS